MAIDDPLTPEQIEDALAFRMLLDDVVRSELEQGQEIAAGPNRLMREYAERMFWVPSPPASRKERKIAAFNEKWAKDHPVEEAA